MNHLVEVTCEGRLGGLLQTLFPMQHPVHVEILSSVSATVIIICGTHMLVLWRTDSQTLLLIASLFLVNGVTSLASHLTLQPLWAIADRWSMLIVAWIALGFVVDELVALASDLAKRQTHKARTVGWIVASFAVVAGLAYDSLHHDAVVVDLLIATPLTLSLTLGTAVCYFDKHPERRGIATTRQWTHARTRFAVGCVLVALGLGSELASIPLCRRLPWIPYHAAWHVLMAIGLLQTLAFAAVLHLDRRRHAGLVLKGCIFPRIDYTPLETPPRTALIVLERVGVV